MAQHTVIFSRLNEIEQEVQGRIEKAIILNNLRLKESIFPDSEIEKKSLEIQIGSDGKATMESFKAYNILEFTQSEFRISILTSLGAVGGLISATSVGTVLGILGLIGTFLSSSKKTFNELEAKVLISVYRLGSMCHIKTIPIEYQNSFGENLAEDRLQAALRELMRYKVIELKGEEVEIIETVNIAR